MIAALLSETKSKSLAYQRAKVPLVRRAVAAQIPKRGMTWEHKKKSQQMRNKLLLRFLGVGEIRQYTLQQSHGVPPFSVVSDNTTIE